MPEITIIGDSKAGKSTLLECLEAGESFQFIEESHKATIGFEMKSKMLQGTLFRLWDTSGAERYQNMIQPEIERADAIIIAIDLSKDDPNAVMQFLRWVGEIGTKLGQVPVILAGTKSDIDGAEERLKKLKTHLDEHHYDHFDTKEIIKTSAKTKINVKELFDITANKIEEAKRAQQNARLVQPSSISADDPHAYDVPLEAVVNNVPATAPSFGQRHKGKLIAAGVVTGILILGLVLTTIFFPPAVPFVLGLLATASLILPEGALGIFAVAALSAVVGLLAGAIVTATLFVVDAIAERCGKSNSYGKLPDSDEGSEVELSSTSYGTSYRKLVVEGGGAKQFDSDSEEDDDLSVTESPHNNSRRQTSDPERSTSSVSSVSPRPG